MKVAVKIRQQDALRGEGTVGGRIRRLLRRAGVRRRGQAGGRETGLASADADLDFTGGHFVDGDHFQAFDDH
jgi:hypothetical protein